MFRFKLVIALGLALALGRSSIAATSLTETFSSNPFAPTGNWLFGIGDNSNHQFTWTNTPAVYTGDPIGELDVHLNSSLPTARFQRPLGVIVTDTDDFTLTARFSFTITSAPEGQDMQIAFGLVNSTSTGGNRTGTAGVYTDDDTFSTVEFDYFPNDNPWDPTLTPTVFGAQEPGFDAFGNIGFVSFELAANTNGVTNLPQRVTLQATLAYSGATKSFTLSISQVNSNGTLTLLDTELPALDLPGGQSVYSTYDTNFPFVVDTLAIMAYQDGFTTTDNPSLVADLRFQKFDFTTSASPPQPPTDLSIKLIATNVLLTFSTISSNSYYVQSRTDLVSGSWSTIASNIMGTGGIATNIDFGAATVPQKFYRVGLSVP